MIRNIRSKTAGVLAVTILVIFCSIYSPRASHASGSDINKIRVAVFPFNDVRYKSLDMNVTAVLKAELFKHEFIDLVPVEIIREIMYEIEPSFLWTGMEGNEKRGGILWRIEPAMVEEIDRRVFADLYIYGDITRFGDRWRIDSYIVNKGMIKPQRTVVITGKREDEIPEKLKGLAQEIMSGISDTNIVNMAEEDIKKYMGGTYTYTSVIERIKGRLDLLPYSIPLRSLLLDLYLREKDINRDMIMKQGLRIVELYDPSHEDDTRYLLSLSLDPFEAVAEIYEFRKEWKAAIETRIDALNVFPYNAKDHKDALGRDHFYLGLALEEKREEKEARDNYRKSVTYLPHDSEYYLKAKERIAALSKVN